MEDPQKRDALGKMGTDHLKEIGTDPHPQKEIGTYPSKEMGTYHSKEIGTYPQIGVQDNRPRSPINGQPLPIGRQKGQVNKLTRTFKAAAEQAFEKGGGVDWLVKLMNGTASDRAAVLGLFGRLIPHQLVGHVDHKVKVELSWLGGRSIGKTDVNIQSPAQIEHNRVEQGYTDVEAIDVTDERQTRDVNDTTASDEP